MNENTGQIFHVHDRLALAVASVIQGPPPSAVAPPPLEEKLIELRGDPDPKCSECRGTGAAGGGKGTDGKFHPCRCCAMPLYWCNVHRRQATHLYEMPRHLRGMPRCNPQLPGITMPCQCVNLTGLVELE